MQFIFSDITIQIIRLCCFLVLFLLKTICFSQTLFIGEKPYSIIESFTLNAKSRFQDRDLYVDIAQNKERTLIAVSTDVMGGGVRIKGQLSIYLSNDKVITCIDRSIFSVLNDVAMTVYYLTNSELNMIQNSSINTIRFSLKCYSCTYSTEEGDFAATRKTTSLEDIINKQKYNSSPYGNTGLGDDFWDNLQNNNQSTSSRYSNPTYTYGGKQTKTKFSGKLRDSSDPYGNVIKYIPKNAKIRVIEHERADYWKVFYDGKTGYLNELYFHISYEISLMKTNKK